MMNKCALALLLLVAACAYPVPSTRAVDAKPHLGIDNAPAGAVLAVDGVGMGEARQFAPAQRLLAVEAGTHHVVVTLSGRVLLDQNIYFGDSADHIISVPN